MTTEVRVKNVGPDRVSVVQVAKGTTQPFVEAEPTMVEVGDEVTKYVHSGADLLVSELKEGN